jgi:hypothetical protein
METSEPAGVRVKARVLPPLWRVRPRRPVRNEFEPAVVLSLWPMSA